MQESFRAGIVIGLAALVCHVPTASAGRLRIDARKRVIASGELEIFEFHVRPIDPFSRRKSNVRVNLVGTRATAETIARGRGTNSRRYRVRMRFLARTVDGLRRVERSFEAAIVARYRGNKATKRLRVVVK